jgi:hypothetical protein
VPRQTRIRWDRLAGLLVVLAATAAALGALSPPPPPATDLTSVRTPPAGLDPELQDALDRATADAARDGIEIVVTSGRRSPAHQRRLLREAVATYGSAAEAARWVATPETSPHVSGDAVDLGPDTARAWLAAHGAAYGLCPVYRNEPWHFELRADAAHDGCPPLYPDPTHDPRMFP